MASDGNGEAPGGEPFAWDDLLDNIADGKVVPVIGHELLEADYEGQRIALQGLLAQRLAASRGFTVQTRRHFELNDAVAAYLEMPRVHPDDPYPQVTRAYRNLKPAFPVPHALELLASIRPLDLFVSATPDDLMARALDKVRHRGNEVTRRLAFSLKQSTAAQAQAMEEPRDGVPVVFNLFGQFSTLAEYALHEEDALEYIHGLVSRDATPPDWLMSRLRDRVLLLIGVHLPDWLERFVLRTVNRGPLRSDRRTYYIAREIEPSAAAVALFFQRFGRDARLNVYRGSAADFVAELQRRWREREPETGEVAPAPPPARGSIFISYDWQNKAAVQRLHQAVAEVAGGDVWFDQQQLPPGSTWHRDILSQIRERVQLFVAVLSDQTEGKPASEGVVFEEWNEALARARRFKWPRSFILPVVIDADATSADPARYPSLMRTFPDFANYTFGLAPNGVPDPALLRALVEQIKLYRTAQG